MKKIAISQSNYIPWKGYFDMINSVDEFILYDDMQYTKRDWRNRNQILTPTGPLWLSIPVKVKGKYFQKISDTEIENQNWAENHWKTIKNYYSKAPYFSEYADKVESIYNQLKDEVYLSKINFAFIQEINKILGIQTKISWSSEYGIIEGKTERLVDLCLKAQANLYISGPAAKDYMDVELFKEKSIEVKWMNYSNYAEYHQQYLPFSHAVSVLDLIFNTGDQANTYMKSFGEAITYE